MERCGEEDYHPGEPGDKSSSFQTLHANSRDNYGIRIQQVLPKSFPWRLLIPTPLRFQ